MKIAIIGAMEEEVAILRDKMTETTITNVAGCEFTEGILEGKKVILSKSGIGKVNAAMSTSLLLQIFQPHYILNTGSAGGFNPKLQVGDLVISTEIRHHDVDVTIFGYEYGQVPQLPAAFKADDRLIGIAEEAAKGIEGVQTVKGLIATGDSFMNEPERVEFVRGKFPELQAAEMEAAAIAQVAYLFGKPFLIIRALSDIAGKESNVSFEQFLDKAAKHSAELIVNIVKNL
ncbi:MAG TPA: 5'-methylthioadenosine/S-adenosylhomocysteine nucleosidase [Bacillus sp. (in: firmicutes)]|uniref:5'-methylthioadenosine/S-adenosylhomocysteine nucleosidase n=1 Tax=Bacillus litorisediminis TaxID=2922713 RepID=UPI001FACA578|nr:5'-methylthioadenosine/S-adenosylhomocysteine nucleosidase [Bacillus litorisediminis]HWO74740.1 5'-methylthioadenosine/S-adenosylhomocysteine nucleosidase [Bacillus sp. (in: firmicutes)]